MELISKDHEQLLAPFVSMSLSEVKKVECYDKVMTVINSVWFLLDLVLSYVPGWDSISGIVDMVLEIITFACNQMRPPLRRILVEAKDANDCITPFIITDRRSCWKRVFRCCEGRNMELALLADETTALLTTTGKRSCCCCCKTREDYLVDANDPTKVYATYVHPKCGRCCCFKWATMVHKITSSGTDYGFVQPGCGFFRMSRNRIKPDKELEEGQLAVKKNQFSGKDFCFTIIEIGMGEIMEEVDMGALGAATAEAIELTVGVVEEATGDAVDLAATAKDVVTELKDARQQLKEKGFKKLGFTWSIWDVEFQEECPGPQKLATLLFLIGVYYKVITR